MLFSAINISMRGIGGKRINLPQYKEDYSSIFGGKSFSEVVTNGMRNMGEATRMAASMVPPAGASEADLTNKYYDGFRDGFKADNYIGFKNDSLEPIPGLSGNTVSDIYSHKGLRKVARDQQIKDLKRMQADGSMSEYHTKLLEGFEKDRYGGITEKTVQKWGFSDGRSKTPATSILLTDDFLIASRKAITMHGPDAMKHVKDVRTNAMSPEELQTHKIDDFLNQPQFAPQPAPVEILPLAITEAGEDEQEEPIPIPSFDENLKLVDIEDPLYPKEDIVPKEDNAPDQQLDKVDILVNGFKTKNEAQLRKMKKADGTLHGRYTKGMTDDERFESNRIFKHHLANMPPPDHSLKYNKEMETIPEFMVSLNDKKVNELQDMIVVDQGTSGVDSKKVTGLTQEDNAQLKDLILARIDDLQKRAEAKDKQTTIKTPKKGKGGRGTPKKAPTPKKAGGTPKRKLPPTPK